MLLYDSAVSGNCYKVRLLLAHRGIAYERRAIDVVDRSNRAELLGDLNPALSVPVLTFDDGRSLAESNAIIAYLAEGTRFMPEDRFERAQVLQWLFFEQYSHEPNIAVPIYWCNYAADPPPEKVIERRRVDGRVALAAMERHLSQRGYIVGERMSIADIALYAYTHRAPAGGFDLEGLPAVRAWLARVAGEPGHIAITD